MQRCSRRANAGQRDRQEDKFCKRTEAFSFPSDREKMGDDVPKEDHVPTKNETNIQSRKWCQVSKVKIHLRRCMCSFFPPGRPVRTWDFHLTCQSCSDGSHLFFSIRISVSYGLSLPHHSFWQSKNHLDATWNIWQRFDMLWGTLSTCQATFKCGRSEASAGWTAAIPNPQQHATL